MNRRARSFMECLMDVKPKSKTAKDFKQNYLLAHDFYSQDFDMGMLVPMHDGQYLSPPDPPAMTEDLAVVDKLEAQVYAQKLEYYQNALQSVVFEGFTLVEDKRFQVVAKWEDTHVPRQWEEYEKQDDFFIIKFDDGFYLTDKLIGGVSQHIADEDEINLDQFIYEVGESLLFNYENPIIRRLFPAFSINE